MKKQFSRSISWNNTKKKKAADNLENEFYLDFEGCYKNLTDH